ncbi:MAG: type II toxin-antitoxin system death-on-curing family toxin [Actinobacteria bacterium]|nr:MAG: type II toxin-antitoxin system death-on-curing family toxin [Actinomycetota bacterium]
MVEEIHRRQIRTHGGLAGLRDEGLLESALARAPSAWAYGDRPIVPDLAALYIDGLVRNHPFIDGNKRVGLVVGATFLLLNGHELVATEPDAVLTIRAVAAGQMAREELVEWVRGNVVTFSE